MVNDQTFILVLLLILSVAFFVLALLTDIQAAPSDLIHGYQEDRTYCLVYTGDKDHFTQKQRGSMNKAFALKVSSVVLGGLLSVLTLYMLLFHRRVRVIQSRQ
jgi:hypothetical protein